MSVRRVVAVVLLAVLSACGGDGTDVRTEAQLDSNDPPASVVIDDSVGRDETLRHQQEQSTDGILYRVHVRGEPADGALSVTAGGLVVRVADTSVFRSVDEFTSWRLTPAGVASLQLAIAESGLLELDNTVFGDADPSSGVSAGIFVGQGRVIDVHDVEARSGFTPEQAVHRERFRALLKRLTDHAWLGDDVVSRPEPWIPDRLSVTAVPDGSSPGRPAAAAATAPRPWPLDIPIRALAGGRTIDGPYGPRLVLCITGEQVAPVWRLQTGANTAYLQVDDGEQWELDVLLGYPGYRLSDDPCASE